MGTPGFSPALKPRWSVAHPGITRKERNNRFVQPLWLGWTLTHWDFAFGYGFYAPTGRYDTETVTLPRGVTVTAEAADNIGLGFWTHQLQGVVTWYPWAHKATAVVAVLTYEIHGDKQDFDLRPGQNLTLNWGISQFLPLRQDQQLLLEVGLTGYSSWQITDDSGSDARTPSVHDQVHAVGGQLGLTCVPWGASLNTHYFGEFAAQDRFQGQVFGISVAKKFYQQPPERARIGSTNRGREKMQSLLPSVYARHWQAC
jgi:hypothetical protein